MSQSLPVPPPGFDALTSSEKVDYIEALWELVLESGDVPVPDWHRELLNERLASFRAEPDAGRPWSEVQAELERKYASRT